MEEERVGTIIHYWPKAGAAQVELEKNVLHVGDVIRIRGRNHDFVQEIESMEIDHVAMPEGHPGEYVAIAVLEPVHEGDEVVIIRQGESFVM